MPSTAREIDAQIKRLQDRKALIAERDRAVQPAIDTLAKYADVLTPAQRRKVAKLIASDGAEAPASKQARKAGKKAAKKTGTKKVAPKFQLPTGELWTGRGRMPKVFATWARSRAGREWAKENPEAKFPAPGGAPAAATAPVKKATKKAAKKVVKKGAKKAVKKAGKRATKRAIATEAAAAE